jgi:hypothetical protein
MPAPLVAPAVVVLAVAVAPVVVGAVARLDSSAAVVAEVASAAVVAVAVAVVAQVAVAVADMPASFLSILLLSFFRLRRGRVRNPPRPWFRTSPR